jgi:hypothetical protein
VKKEIFYRKNKGLWVFRNGVVLRRDLNISEEHKREQCTSQDSNSNSCVTSEYLDIMLYLSK